jgi:hypothetical protein
MQNSPASFNWGYWDLFSKYLLLRCNNFNLVYSQSTQSDGPVCFLIFCSIGISLLASLVAGRRPQCSAGPP